MGEHMHRSGEVMLSYRYSRMRMSGNRSRTEHQSTGDVFARGFAITPTDMDMEMHMIGAMWAPADRVTLMGMLPIVVLSMDHKNRVGGRFTTEASGIGDVKLSSLIRLWDGDAHDVHLNAGFSIPTGSIDETDNVLTPMGQIRTRLPYPMQLGSGSLDALPGITYNGRVEDLSWGAQALGTIRLYQNSHRYKLGDGSAPPCARASATSATSVARIRGSTRTPCRRRTRTGAGAGAWISGPASTS
jgi:hypothetical protein